MIVLKGTIIANGMEEDERNGRPKGIAAKTIFKQGRFMKQSIV